MHKYVLCNLLFSKFVNKKKTLIYAKIRAFYLKMSINYPFVNYQPIRKETPYKQLSL